MAEFIVESVEFLEQIASSKAPPFNMDEIEQMREELEDQIGDQAHLRKKLGAMEEPFKERGDLSSWSPEVLEKIDQCFIRCYTGEDKELVPSLFFPDSPQNLNCFRKYCGQVDNVLRECIESAPPYVREYFSYYSIWQIRDRRFPAPLGTRSVVAALRNILNGVENGFAEASLFHSPSLPFPRTNVPSHT